MTKSKEVVSLVAVGDICIQRENPEDTFAKVSTVFNQADALFCNLEGPLSDKLEHEVALGQYAHRSDPKMISTLRSAGFNAVSTANNVMMSYGPQALLDTIKILDKNKIAHTGAGPNLSEAKKPAILNVKGTRIAFLAYAVLERRLVENHYLIASDPTHARKARAGVNPLGYSPVYEPPQVDPDDLEVMREDVRKTKDLADVVVVSYHWHGPVSHTPAMYMRAYARSAIDEGADLILGHGPHILYGMELYKGKAIAYSLGELVFDRAVCPLPFELTHAEETMILKCLIVDKEIKSVSFLPALVGGIGVVPSGHPTVLSAEGEEGRRILRLMDKLSQRLGTELSFEGDEAIVLKRS